MDQQIHPAQQPDYHQYDRVWQRVAPDLEPWPGYSGQTVPQPLPPSPVAPQPDPVPPQQPPVAPPVPPVHPPLPPEAQLPGGIKNPCCLGSEALELLQVLTGFIEEELIDRRYFCVLATKAPSWAKAGLRELADRSAAHVKELLAVCYMITGQCYRPQGVTGEVYIGAWCPALRERYHTEACDGLNYARTAESTADPCLKEILLRLSREAYRSADALLEMLQKSMNC